MTCRHPSGRLAAACHVAAPSFIFLFVAHKHSTALADAEANARQGKASKHAAVALLVLASFQFSSTPFSELSSKV